VADPIDDTHGPTSDTPVLGQIADLIRRVQCAQPPVVLLASSREAALA
jgi:hypothetical protein